MYEKGSRKYDAGAGFRIDSSNMGHRQRSECGIAFVSVGLEFLILILNFVCFESGIWYGTGRLGSAMRQRVRFCMLSTSCSKSRISS